MRKTEVIFNSKSTMHTREVYIVKVIKILTIHVDGKPMHTIPTLSDSVNVNVPPKCTQANSDGSFSPGTNLTDCGYHVCPGVPKNIQKNYTWLLKIPEEKGQLRSLEEIA